MKARALLAAGLLIAAGLVLPACLVPQPLVPEEEGSGLDDPPRILGRAPDASVIRTQRGCGKQKLEVLSVEDMDEEDPIEIRWFVNYQQGNTAPVRRKEIPSGFGFQEGIRTPPGDAFEVFFNQYEDQVLVVEAVVSDGFDADAAREPANRAPAKGKAVTQSSWTIFVESAQECLP